MIVTGDDAVSFLQSQLTNDVEQLTAEQPLRSAWCNPKGRVIALMTLTRQDDAILLRLPTDLADTVTARLTMFRFRSKVDFAPGEVERVDQPALHERLLAGEAEIWAAQSEQFTAHMLNLDLLGVVSLDKGCYPGQEIVARTHYRGASKRRLFLFQAEQPVSAGDKVSNGERDVGEVVNAIGNDLLAVVPGNALDTDLQVNGAKLSKMPLPYLHS